MKLSKMKVSREYAEFVDLNYDRELRLELSFSQSILFNLEDDKLETMTFDHLYRNGGFSSLNFYQRDP